jgi:hypothetical protein
MLAFATQSFQLFWWGVCIGLAQRDNLPALVASITGCQAIAAALEPFGSSIEEAQARARQADWVTAFIEKLASDGLQHAGEEPESLLDLFAEAFSPLELDFRDLRKVQSMVGKTVPLEIAGMRGANSFLAGLSLGLNRPELAKRLKSKIYGSREDAWYLQLELAGGLGPPTPVEERQAVEALGIDDIGSEVALALLSVYSQLCAPDLMGPLGVTPHLSPDLTGSLASDVRSFG